MSLPSRHRDAGAVVAGELVLEAVGQGQVHQLSIRRAAGVVKNGPHLTPGRVLVLEKDRDLLNLQDPINGTPSSPAP